MPLSVSLRRRGSTVQFSILVTILISVVFGLILYLRADYIRTNRINPTGIDLTGQEVPKPGGGTIVVGSPEWNKWLDSSPFQFKPTLDTRAMSSFAVCSNIERGMAPKRVIELLGNPDDRQDLLDQTILSYHVMDGELYLQFKNGTYAGAYVVNP